MLRAKEIMALVEATDSVLKKAYKLVKSLLLKV